MLTTLIYTVANYAQHCYVLLSTMHSIIYAPFLILLFLLLHYVQPVFSFRY
jgi:hypothetical protein